MQSPHKNLFTRQLQPGKSSESCQAEALGHDEVEDQFARMLEEARSADMANPEQLNKLKASILSDLHPVRPLLSPVIIAAAFFGIFAAITILSILFLKSYGWDVLVPMQKITVFTTLGATAALLAFSLARQMIPGSKQLAPAGLIPIGLFVLLCLVVASVFQARSELHFLRNGMVCVALGSPFALPSALLFALILRRGARLSPYWTAISAGMLAGLVSTSVLEVHCPNMNMWHILVWHFGLPFAGGVIGALLALIGQRLRRLLA